jgi:dTDP-4-dehydrorhamnose 3,5-epimerase
MIIQDTKIDKVKVIKSQPFRDERGFFNRLFCQRELDAIRPGLEIKQINHSKTRQKGAVRGLHFQLPPSAEIKIVRCTKGEVFDVAVDLRKDSPTFLQYYGEILSEDNMSALVIPEGFAHGFQALADEVELVYFVSAFYDKDSEGSVRYDEPKVGIKWPLEVTLVSKKDLSVPYLTHDFKGIVL